MFITYCLLNITTGLTTENNTHLLLHSFVGQGSGALSWFLWPRSHRLRWRCRRAGLACGGSGGASLPKLFEAVGRIQELWLQGWGPCCPAGCHPGASLLSLPRPEFLVIIPLVSSNQQLPLESSSCFESLWPSLSDISSSFSYRKFSLWSSC